MKITIDAARWLDGRDTTGGAAVLAIAGGRSPTW
jgi:hypothetical protein